jgi:PAS domain S-box-containing protein
MRRIIELGPDVLFRVRLTPHLKLEYVNRAVLALTGYSPEDWYADSTLASRVVHRDDLRRIHDPSAIVAQAQPIVMRLTRRSGAVAWAEMYVVPIHGRQGSLMAVEGIARDITVTRAPAAASESNSLAAAVLEHQEITVHLDRLAVTCGGQPVMATPREVLLLRYFIQHRGEMLSRDQLLQNVWGSTFTGGSRTVDVHVSRLRQKLPLLATTLVTIGNVGYTLREEEGEGKVGS